MPREDTHREREAKGRPPGWFRFKMREIMAENGFERLEAVVNSESDANALRAIEVLLKFGLGEAKTVTEEEMLKAVATVASKYVPPKDMEAFVNELIDLLKQTA